MIEIVIKLDGAGVAGLAIGETVVPARPAAPQSATTGSPVGEHTPNRQRAAQGAGDTAQAHLGDLIRADRLGDWEFIPDNVLALLDANGHRWERDDNPQYITEWARRISPTFTMRDYSRGLIEREGPLTVALIGSRPYPHYDNPASNPDDNPDDPASNPASDPVTRHQAERMRAQLDAIQALAEDRQVDSTDGGRCDAREIWPSEILTIIGDPHTPPATPSTPNTESDTHDGSDQPAEGTETAGTADRAAGRADGTEDPGWVNLGVVPEPD